MFNGGNRSENGGSGGAAFPPLPRTRSILHRHTSHANQCPARWGPTQQRSAITHAQVGLSVDSLSVCLIIHDKRVWAISEGNMTDIEFIYINHDTRSFVHLNLSGLTGKQFRQISIINTLQLSSILAGQMKLE